MSTKSSILSKLKSAKDFVSGESLAELCDVSRTAVWKAIQSLQNEGYRINAVTNRGYKLEGMPDKLNPSEIQSYLEKNKINGIKIFTFSEIDSTNSEAKRLAAETGAFRNSNGSLTQKGENANLSLFVAESQTGGKGRMGRVFVSPKDCGIYFSLLYSPQGGVKNPALYTAAAAVSVCRAIKKLYGEQPSIKWVNDLFLGGKKICGILVEGSANFETGIIDAAIIGIGINIRKNPSLSGEISKIAGSIEEAKILKNEEFPFCSKNILVAETVKNLIEFYGNLEEKKSEMIQEYRSLSMLTGKSVMVNPVAGTNGETYKATVKEIDEEMRLVVEKQNGEFVKLGSGEVSLHSYDFI